MVIGEITKPFLGCFDMYFMMLDSDTKKINSIRLKVKYQDEETADKTFSGIEKILHEETGKKGKVALDDETNYAKVFKYSHDKAYILQKVKEDNTVSVFLITSFYYLD